MSTDKQTVEKIQARNPYTDPTSLEFKFRARRFAKVRELIEDALEERGEAHILDLGGTEGYWLIGEDFINQHRGRLKITLVNLAQEVKPVGDTALFTSLAGDAASPDLFPGEQFDLVHSNSVIEHVGDWSHMTQFANNTKRLGKRYYMQTPNYWFPYEPHFRTLGFQFLPESARIALIQRVAMGFFPRIESYEKARDIIKHHSIISTRQVRQLFSGAEITHEKFMGLNKSIIAIKR
ncbi:SAM-dependent methyltransferase [Phyllobacterium leguminum]|uniref:Methyltransferase family protein n=1 Tax=Phyllobacterium leguminum TaxID=314237 RepID=A0A318TA35_9HYPH|nr:class I SAM-dependent methyltransferase [Phyllobacterium leguminum]PYE89729.1 methyltransferase family protein [Phyllobacterium leguminum]